jgi:hypothetical protein
MEMNATTRSREFGHLLVCVRVLGQELCMLAEQGWFLFTLESSRVDMKQTKKTRFRLVALVCCTLLVLVWRLPLNKQQEIYSVMSRRYLDAFCHWVDEQGPWISQECSLL